VARKNGEIYSAGSDLVFQMHYTANGRAASDRSSIGLIFSKHAPEQRGLDAATHKPTIS